MKISLPLPLSTVNLINMRRSHSHSPPMYHRHYFSVRPTFATENSFHLQIVHLDINHIVVKVYLVDHFGIFVEMSLVYPDF